MVTYKNLTIIGRVETVVFPEIGIKESHARIDTGAQTSAIWASSIELNNNHLAVQFFGPGHELFDGKIHYFDTFRETIVASSNGHREHRYKVKLLVYISGRKIRASFTLADRSMQVYPILIGRNVLRAKFVVDVNLGEALTEKEVKRSQVLQSRIKQGDKA